MSSPAQRKVPVPQWTPTQRELDDLELLVGGCLAPPLPGFVEPGTSSPLPVTLTVSETTAEIAGAVGLLDIVDPEGAPLARLTVERSWATPDRDRVGLVGPVTKLAHNEFGAFRRLHVPPVTLHESQSADSLLAVPVHRPLTDGDLEDIARVAASEVRTPLLLACVGDGMPEGVSGPALVRATLAAAARLDDSTALAVALADHGWTADASGQSPNDRLLDSVGAAYASATYRISRTASGRHPTEVAAIVDHDRPPRDQQGAVIFFTGLSGSGKSTLARALVDHVLEQGERTVTSLDGDVIRHHLSKGLGFNRADRETNILRIGFVAAEIARHGGLAICSPIAPFESTRAEVRRMVERAGGGFVLIHVATPLEECERRDRKGLYAKARAGEIPDFTGISSPYEPPVNSYKLDTTNRDIAECLSELLGHLTSEGWLHP
ncbi:MAG: adenylyl-sulfate kinase [Nocardioidaceae bacterium]